MKNLKRFAALLLALAMLFALAACGGSGDGKTNETFLKIWVAKEALVKLSGEGMAAITRTDSVNLPQNIEKKELADYPGYTVVTVRKTSEKSE